MRNLKIFFANLPRYSSKELGENVPDLIAHRSLGAKEERAWSKSLP